MRLRPALLLAMLLGPMLLFTVLATAEAQQAGWTQDAQRCAQETDRDLALHYCSRATQSGRLSAAMLAITLNNRGVHYAAKGEHDRAIQDFSEAIRLDANYARAFYNRGNTYAEMGEHDRAIQDFDKAIRLDPKYAKAFYNRGLSYVHKRNYDEAIQDFEQASRLNPNNPPALYNLGRAYADKGDYDRAIQAYERAIRVNPSFAAAFYSRGLAHAHKGQYHRAIQDFSESIRLNPTDATAFYNRGTAYLDKREYQELDRAIRDFDEAIRLDPGHAGAFNHRGKAHLQKGEYDQAIQDFDRAIRLDPSSTASFYNRGITKFIGGQFGEAASDLTKAVDNTKGEEVDRLIAYRIIWRYLAQARGGERGSDSLATGASRLDLKRWPGPVISMYLGRVTPEAALKAATTSGVGAPAPERACEVYFFLGEHVLMQGLRDEASRMFQAAVATGELGAYECHSAEAELRRMRH